MDATSLALMSFFFGGGSNGRRNSMLAYFDIGESPTSELVCNREHLWIESCLRSNQTADNENHLQKNSGARWCGYEIIWGPYY